MRYPFIETLAPGFGLRIPNLLRVVDDEDVAAQTGQRPGDGRRLAEAPFGCEDFSFMTSPDLHRKGAFVPGRFDERSEIAGMFGGELVGVADDKDPMPRFGA